MIYSYSELLERKKKGDKLDWDNITKEQLEKLFIEENLTNNMIADLYDVDPQKVRYKRSKWNITINSAKYIYDSFKNRNSEMFASLNEDSKQRILRKENIDFIAKGLTHYLFRNGPVEDIHASGKLSQEDMKTLNKYMVNKIAGLVSLIIDGEWLKIEMLLNFLGYYGVDWDKAVIDTEDIEALFAAGLEETVNGKRL